MEMLVKIRSFVLVCAIAAALPVLVHLSKLYFYPFELPQISKSEPLKLLEQKIQSLDQQLDEQREAFKDEELKLLAYQAGKKDFEEKMGVIKTIKQELKTLRDQEKELSKPLREQEKQNYKAGQNHRLKLFVIDMIIALVLILFALLLPHALLQTASMLAALIITLSAYTQTWSDLSTGVLLLTVLAWFILLIFLVIRLYEKSVAKN